ncbi:hypothetical protein AB0H28_13260 [Micromonospora sp. NPDC050980]|uniref:hypothetical protein n=1 Tax=Micromonospora sp. NPDC050980 TaxID=3155161 RepID=UPI003408718F
MAIREAAAVRPIPEFADLPEWPRGARLRAIRQAASTFKARFVAQGTVLGVRTVPIGYVPYPTRYAFAGAVRGLGPYVFMENRLVVVRFHDFAGAERLLVWSPAVGAGTRQAPFYRQLSAGYPRWLTERVFSREYHTPVSALATLNLAPFAVDFAAFDHLHVQDPRYHLGTTVALAGEAAPREPILPRATFVCQRREVDTLRDPHPMQWPWYVEDGFAHAREDRLLEVEADVELGVGVALVRTPGHTDGNQSLVLHTSDGVWVSSENGVCADNWQPDRSSIRSLRGYATAMGWEVVPNANTLEDSVDQYDSMVKEKLLADVGSTQEGWLNILPSTEVLPWRRQGVRPTVYRGGLSCGRIQ